MKKWSLSDPKRQAEFLIRLQTKQVKGMQHMKNALSYLIALYRAEPVRVNAAIVNVAVIVASYFDVVIDPDSVWQVLAIVGAVTGIAELTRRKVTPA